MTAVSFYVQIVKALDEIDAPYMIVGAFACNLSAGSVPSENTPTAATQVLPSATAIPAMPTLTSIPPAALGTIALDFVALLCNAKWMNGGQHLIACPAADADHSGGYAVALDPVSENLPADTSVLLTIPATNGYAALFLQYPAFTVHKGDRFRATLRCQTEASCNVEYALEYFDANGKYSGPFASWNYTAGAAPIDADYDLSALAGKTVDFVLTLRPNNDPPKNDESLWIAPHIYRP